MEGAFGRGSLTDSFPLFGFELADYETLLEEKLDLLTRLLRQSKEVNSDPTVIDTLDAHLTRLDSVAQNTERLLEELDAAAES